MLFNTKFNLIDEKDVDILDDLTRILLENHLSSLENKENKTNQENSNDSKDKEKENKEE